MSAKKLYERRHKSAIKAHRRSLKRRIRNKGYRTRAKNLMKSLRNAIDSTDVLTEELVKLLRTTLKYLDHVASKGIFHKNKSARLKSRLMARFNKKFKEAYEEYLKKEKEGKEG